MRDESRQEACRLTIIHDTCPYPPTDGGKADVWARLTTLSRLGARIQLVCWPEGPLSSPARAAVQGVVESLVTLKRRPRWAGFAELRYPPRIRRFVSGSHGREAERPIAAFKPDALVLENWPAYLFARRAAATLAIPLLYRSQNVEHAYWKALTAGATGIWRWRIGITSSRMAALERRIRADASVVLDISQEDADDVQALGWSGRTMVVPPVWLGGVCPGMPWKERDIDVMFAGNLWTPNNVEGLTWFLDRVLPFVRERIPQVRVLVAGSRPAKVVMMLCQRVGVECVPDPEEVGPLLSRARVLINPQRAGGGVSIKMMEFLAHAAWVVSTPSGGRGLPDPKPAQMRVADDPKEFADAIADGLREPPDGASGASYLQAHFGPQRLEEVLSLVKTLPPYRDPE